ncbi:MAG TPA: RHS repeat-associated core domain-containing protein, partial [candidate division Zixibacteria bacterium]|nr:RHS repeat-associated core domain-containing protein [candidate division Zixibacteria bacterium]
MATKESFRRQINRFHFGRVYKLVTFAVVLTMVINAILPAASVFALPTEQTGASEIAGASPLSGKGQVNLPGPMGTAVNTFNGNLFYQHPGFYFPHSLPVDTRLTYNSLRGNFASSLGYYGWQFTYDISYRVDENLDVTIVWGDGREVRFDSPYRALTSVFIAKQETLVPDGTDFAAPPGVRDVLRSYEPGKFVLTTPDQTTYYFDSARHHRVTRIQHPSGQALVFQYNSAGLLDTLQHTFGQKVKFLYSTVNDVPTLTAMIDITGTLHRFIFFAYDGSGNLSQITNPELAKTRFTYDAGHKMTGITDPKNNKLTINYTGHWVRDLVTPLSTRSISHRDDNILGRTYTGHTLIVMDRRHTTVVDVVSGRSQRTVYNYDSRGRLTNSENALGNIQYIEWDDKDNAVQFTDELGRITTYTHDERGNVLTVTDPWLRTNTFTYHPEFNHLTSVRDGNGFYTSYNYDGRGNLIRSDLPNGGIQRFAYDSFGNVISDTTPVGDTFSYAYDGYGYLSGITDPLGQSSTFVNDHRGNILLGTDANTNTLTSQYDNLDRILSSTNGENNKTTFGYDARGNLIEFTDPNGNGYQYDYDALERLSSVTDPLGRVTWYEYDERDNLISSTDANGHTTTYSYDLMERLHTKTNPLGQTTSYLYDAVGNMSQRTDANGESTVFSYGANDLLSAINYPGSDYDVNFTSFDGADNLLRQTSPAADIDYRYDQVDLITQVGVSVSSLFTRTTYYSYDNMGRRSTMTDPDGGLTNYTYNLRGDLESITDPDGNLTSFDYDPAGRLERQNNANGTYALYTYDDADRLVTLNNHKSNGVLISGYSYTYDDAGNCVEMVEAAIGTTSYDYDALNQLLEVIYPDGRSVDYTYDAVGNRLNSIDSLMGETIYEYDEANQLIYQHTPTQTITYSYDNNGNLLSKQDASGVASYTYDYENHLANIGYPDGQSEQFFAYPGQTGLQLKSGSNGVIDTYYFHDLQNTLLETDAAGITVARYTAGLGYDDWVSMKRDGVNYAYHPDGLGSIIGLTDGGENVVAAYRYDAFGNMLEDSGGIVNPYRYTGRAYETKSGLYYYRARFYDPTTGRFTSPDPVNGSISYPHIRHPFIYALNNPFGYTDPTGEAVVTIVVGAIILGGSIFFMLKKLWNMGNQTQQKMTNTAIARRQITNKNTRNVGNLANAVARQQVKNNRRRVGDLAHGTEEGFKAMGKVATAAFPKLEIPSEMNSQVLELYEDAKKVKDVADKAAAAGGAAGKFFGPKSQVMSFNPDPAADGAGQGFDPGSPSDGSSSGGYAGDAPPEEQYYEPPPRLPDHQDDTFSVASRQFPSPGSTGLTTSNALPLWFPQSNPETTNLETTTLGSVLPAYRRSPRIAVFWNGFAEEAAAFLTALGEPFDTLDPDFAPAIAATYPVLLIPSAGLIGLYGSTSLRSRLEDYVNQGGVILVSTQQHGYEFSALPGNLGGYGWQEDQSCFDAAVRFPQYHQALSSFQQESLDLLVDGYFSAFPENAITLLERDKNGYPAALLYPHGGGYVMATTVYADWGSSNYQYSRHDYQVWRDLVAWSTLGALEGYDHSFPDFAPAEQVTGTVQMLNLTGQEAAAVRLVTLDPYKNIAGEQTITTTVTAGVPSSLPFTTTAASPLGVWAVDYVLLDGDGYAIQDQAIGAAFIVSDPAESIGANRNWDFWITSPTENFINGSTGEFTIHARNRTAGPIDNVGFQYYFPHHGAEHRPGIKNGF